MLRRLFHSQGRPLEPGIQGLTHRQLGRDFSRVRVHNDSEAARSAAQIDAEAFTVGRHVVFGAGRYAPTTSTGKALLFHELVHTLQHGDRAPSALTRVAAPDEASEREAGSLAERAMRTQLVASPVPVRESVVHRKKARTRPPQFIGEGASAPIAPGIGEGVDLILIVQVGDETDFTAAMERYVRTVLGGQAYKPVRTLIDIFDELDSQAKAGNRVRRIRIVAHSLKGQVKLFDPGGKKARFFAPKEIADFAKRPETRDIVARAMAPGAVVEFWGCSLGYFPKGAQEWANLFQSKFRAPSVQMKTVSRVFPRRAKRGEVPDSPAEAKRLYGVVLPAGHKVVHSTKEIDSSTDKKLKARFTNWLFEVLIDLGRNQEVVFPSDSNEAERFMRDLFDKAGGDIRQMKLQLKDKTEVGPGDTAAWNQLWATFKPMPLAPETVDQPSPPPTAPAPAPPAPVTPPRVEEAVPSPVAPPPVEEAAPPPVAPTPHEPVEEPAPSPVAPAPVSPPRAEEPAPAVEEVPAPPTLTQPTPAPTPAVPPPTQPAPQAAPARVQPQAPAAPARPPARPQVAAEGVQAVGLDHWILWGFVVGRADPRPSHRAVLDRLARDLISTPGARLLVDGHASHSGSAKLNDDLSRDRARSVAQYLVGQGVTNLRVNYRYFGFDRPWYPAERGESAHNRRVEIVLIRPQAASVAPPSETRPEPEPGPSRAAELVPGITVSVAGAYDLPTKAFGPLLATAGLEGAFKLNFKTKNPETIEVVYKRRKGIDLGLKRMLNDNFQVGVKPSLSAADNPLKNISVKYKGVDLEPEVEIDLEKLADDPKKLLTPLAIKFKAPPVKLYQQSFDEVPELRGIEMDITAELKVVVRIGLTPAAWARIAVIAAGLVGEAGIIAGGALLGTALLVFAYVKITQHAHETGLRWAKTVNVRSGYAWRLAGEAAGYVKGGQLPRDPNNTYMKEAEHKIKLFGAVEDQGRQGVLLAETALLTATNRQEVVLHLSAMGRTVDQIHTAIMLKLGIKDDETLPPLDLTRLR